MMVGPWVHVSQPVPGPDIIFCTIKSDLLLPLCCHPPTKRKHFRFNLNLKASYKRKKSIKFTHVNLSHRKMYIIVKSVQSNDKGYVDACFMIHFETKINSEIKFFSAK